VSLLYYILNTDEKIRFLAIKSCFWKKNNTIFKHCSRRLLRHTYRLTTLSAAAAAGCFVFSARLLFRIILHVTDRNDDGIGCDTVTTILILTSEFGNDFPVVLCISPSGCAYLYHSGTYRHIPYNYIVPN